MSTPRKFTFENAREQAAEVLRRYEAGEAPKDIIAEYDRDSAWFWHRIKMAMKWRNVAEAAR